MANYAPSTRARIADLITGMHVKTIDGGISNAEFTASAQTELFTINGRIAVKQLFIEFTEAADSKAAQVAYNYTMSVPSVSVNALALKCASIASAAAHTRITYIAGTVGGTSVITDGPGVSDVETAGRVCILGGETATGTPTTSTIGILTTDATQASSVQATAHLYYWPMSDGAYAEAVAGV